MLTSDHPGTVAHRTAQRAAEQAGHTVRCLSGLAELAAVPELIRRVWDPQPYNMPLSTDTVTALSLAGCYVGGVLDADRLIGVCIGVFGEPDQRHLHSHIAAVDPSYRGQGIGTVLKLHQRAWALEREVPRIGWTFDPLVRLNAYLNVGKLAATPLQYRQNLYGVFGDPVNGDDESDRLLAEWDLMSDRVRDALDLERDITSSEREMGPIDTLLSVGADQQPCRGHTETRVVAVDIPDHINQLRAARPNLAREWRLAIRDILGGLMADGAAIIGFDRRRGYLLDRQGPIRQPAR